MRARMVGVAAAFIGVALLASLVSADDDGGKRKKKKREAENKVELKELPAAVIAAAQKKAPQATWTSAEKHTTKKDGTVYELHGKISNQSTTMLISSTGEVLRWTEGAEHKGKARGKGKGKAKGDKKPRGPRPLFIVELLSKWFRRHVAPGIDQGSPENGFFRFAKPHFRVTSRAPLALDGLEDFRCRFNEHVLFRRSKLHHAPLIVRPDRREDLAANTKVGMPHVGVLRRLGKTQRQTSELLSSHSARRLSRSVSSRCP
jgi:hypothetical protein